MHVPNLVLNVSTRLKTKLSNRRGFNRPLHYSMKWKLKQGRVGGGRKRIYSVSGWRSCRKHEMCASMHNKPWLIPFSCVRLCCLGNMQKESLGSNTSQLMEVIFYWNVNATCSCELTTNFTLLIALLKISAPEMVFYHLLLFCYLSKQICKLWVF